MRKPTEEEVRRAIDRKTQEEMDPPGARAPTDWQRRFKRDPDEFKHRYRSR